MTNVPVIVAAWLGGRLALGGHVSGADLGNFAIQISDIVQDGETLYSKVEQVYHLEHASFESGLNVVDLLDRKPTIGLEGEYCRRSLVPTVLENENYC